MSTNTSPSDTAIGPDDDTDGVEAAVWATLDEIPDPHLPISLVELAMIYDVQIEAGHVDVELTFPCMGCPAYDFIHDDIRGALRLVDGVDTVDIDVVWDPIWSKDLLDDEVRAKLHESGIGL